MSASLFGTGGTVNVNVNGTLVPQSFTATAGQVLFTLSGWTYTPGTNSLLVFINGQRQVIGRDFTETSTGSFTLVEGCVAGDFVDVIGFPEINLTAVNSGAVNLGGTYSLANYISAHVVSVKDYPFLAKGDGVTDDTAAIQAAIDAFPNQGSPTWQSWALIIPPGEYKVSSKITVKNQQFGRLIGYGAELQGNFNDTILQFGDLTGAADNLWFHTEGLSVVQSSTGSNAYAVRAFHNYSCSYSKCYFYGGQYTFTLDGNSNLIDVCTFRGGILGNVLTAGASNNQANKFLTCSNELSLGYGYVLSVAAGAGGITTISGGYVEANASGNFYIKNSQKVVISDLYFNLQNLAPGIVLDGTVGAYYSQPYVLIKDNNILGDAGISTPFIKEMSANSINAQYSNNRVETGLIDLYGQATKSVNLDRKGKYSSIVNGTSIVNSDATGASDGWTLGGAGNVAAVTSVSPYVNGSACAISDANSYQYQQVNVPANALVRVSVYAKCSAGTAVAQLQLWSLGLGGQYVAASTTSLTAVKLEVVLTPAMRASATAFLILLRNTGAGDTAIFCDVEIEDLTN